MQFINIAVHSVEDVNYRVHLQHEFTLLGLDSYLDVRVCLIVSSRLHQRYDDCLDDRQQYCDVSLISQWRSGKILDLRSIGRGFNSHLDKAA